MCMYLLNLLRRSNGNSNNNILYGLYTYTCALIIICTIHHKHMAPHRWEAPTKRQNHPRASEELTLVLPCACPAFLERIYIITS